MSPRIPAALAAVAFLSACGSDDDTASTAKTTPTTATTQASTATKPPPTLPKKCATNADGVINKLDRTADVGFVTAKRLGSKIRFRPKSDIIQGPLRKGDKVFFTYKKDPKAGPTAICLIPAG